MATLDLFRIRPDLNWRLKEVNCWDEPIGSSPCVHHEVPNLTVRASVFWRGGSATRSQYLMLEWPGIGMGALTIEMNLTEMKILRDEITAVLNYPDKVLDNRSERFDAIIEGESDKC